MTRIPNVRFPVTMSSRPSNFKAKIPPDSYTAASPLLVTVTRRSRATVTAIPAFELPVAMRSRASSACAPIPKLMLSRTVTSRIVSFA